MAVGRKYFLRHGLAGAVAETIAEEAGYSRGAFYSNFDSMEDLFLAVVLEQEERRSASYRAIHAKKVSGPERLKQLRNNCMDLMTDRDWIVLLAEFEAVALVSERMRRRFVEFYRREESRAAEGAEELARLPGVKMNMAPLDLIMATMSFAHGLAVKQRILGSDLSPEKTRALIGSFFDALITPE
jgi:AcrR family transcriptional regulator